MKTFKHNLTRSFAALLMLSLFTLSASALTLGQARNQKLVKETQGLDREAFIHWYYIMISATSTIFSFAAECQDLFDVDPCEDSMVEGHADMLVSMLLGADK